MTHTRKFVTNVGLLIVINLLIKPFWIFGIDRVVQNRIGESEYGFYFALFNFSYIFSIILDFGVNTYNNRVISRNPNRLGEYVLNLFSLKVALSFVYFLLTAVAAFFIFHFSEKLLFTLAILLANQILLSVVLYIRSNFTALHHFKADSFLSVADKLLAILFCGYWLYFSASAITVYHFILSQTFSLFITAAIGGLLLLRQTVIIKRFWQPKFYRFILLKSLPYALMALLMSIYYRIDAVILENIKGAAEVGVYAAGYRMLDAISQFGYLFSIPLLPMLTRLLKSKENIRPLMTVSHQLMFCFSVCSSLFCFVYRSEMTALLYHHPAAKNAEVFGYLLLSFIPIAMVYVYGTLLLAGGKLSIINSVTAVGVVINVALNFLLVEKYGAMGAVAATAITQLYVIAMFIYYCKKDFSFVLSVPEVLRNVGFVLLIGGVLYLLSYNNIDIKYGIALFFIGSILAGFLLKLFDIHAIKALILSVKK